MPIYRVDFAETLGDRTFSTFLTIEAKSEEAAETKTEETQRNLARRWHKNLPFEFIILSVTKVGSRKEQILDNLWSIYPDVYLDLWEPEISTKEMVKTLSKEYPDIFNLLGGQ